MDHLGPEGVLLGSSTLFLIALIHLTHPRDSNTCRRVRRSLHLPCSMPFPQTECLGRNFTSRTPLTPSVLQPKDMRPLFLQRMDLLSVPYWFLEEAWTPKVDSMWY